ncbi:hypothetical protein MHZ36_05465 [Staphylococcus sp. ACRSN]|uniref:hypothetical protein n=1 Tax=Staphylococcus sp. ACRSN TaxID=2918214 RepID=UPI001EF1F63C|nr:hypothetical protein [Staphylococcus sp. ACRSN]MCG7338733.1 hypothetical protein [Staphylococcus sp. ACRSN]
MAIVIFDGFFYVESIINSLINEYKDHLYIFTNKLEVYPLKLKDSHRIHFIQYDYLSKYNIDLLIKDVQLTLNLVTQYNIMQHTSFIKHNIIHTKKDAIFIDITINSDNYEKCVSNAVSKYSLNIKTKILSNTPNILNNATINSKIIDILLKKQNITIHQPK